MVSQPEENHKAVVADQTDMEQATVVAAQVRFPPAALPASPPAKADVHFEGDDHVLVRYLSSIRDQAGVPTYGTKATTGMPATEVSNKFATVRPAPSFMRRRCGGSKAWRPMAVAAPPPEMGALDDGYPSQARLGGTRRPAGALWGSLLPRSGRGGAALMAAKVD